MKKLQYIFAMLFVTWVCNSYAQTNDIITTAVPFLRVSPDTRAGGMGAAGIAVPMDENAVFNNPGKLPYNIEKQALVANYSPWLKEWGSGMYLASLGGFHKLGENEAIYSSVRYFNPGDIRFTDDNGNHLQSYHPNEFAINIGYSRKLSEKIGIALGVKYIRSDLAKGTQNGEDFKVGNAFAVDLGFFYDWRNENGNGWSLGALLSNLGSKITYSKSGDQKNYIPANLGIGSSYTKIFDEQNKLVFVLDINRLLVPMAPSDSANNATYRSKSVVGSWGSSFSNASLKQFQVSFGTEYWYNNQFALRAGYFHEDRSMGDRKYFSTGAGIKYKMLTVNFAYLASTSKSPVKSPLSNTLLFGVCVGSK